VGVFCCSAQFLLQISKVLRKSVKEIELSSKKLPQNKVTSNNLEKYNGVRKFQFGTADKEDSIGKLAGLAWTEVGGELLTIEASKVPGKGRIIKTGSLGDVMQESIQAALTVVRSRSKILGLNPSFHEKLDIHIHVPEGATPKDGPSAGIGMCTALISVLTDIPIRSDTAMTGEITLHGQVLKIGGLKEKLLAAKRAGIKQVIIPEENYPELKEFPKQITKALKIHPVKWIDEVISLALTSEPKAKSSKRQSKPNPSPLKSRPQPPSLKRKSH
jgi:ATP-dependent Lon protease